MPPRPAASQCNQRGRGMEVWSSARAMLNRIVSTRPVDDAFLDGEIRENAPRLAKMSFLEQHRPCRSRLHELVASFFTKSQRAATGTSKKLTMTYLHTFGYGYSCLLRESFRIVANRARITNPDGRKQNNDNHSEIRKFSSFKKLAEKWLVTGHL